MTKQETAVFLGIVKAAYGWRFEVTEEAIEIWSRMLFDLQPHDADRALREHIATSRDPPTVADVRERIAVHDVGAPGWEQAWEDVMGQIARVGREGTPKFKHPTTKAAIDAIGWMDLCNGPAEALATVRAQFRQAYQAIATRAREAANVKQLKRGWEPNRLPPKGEEP